MFYSWVLQYTKTFSCVGEAVMGFFKVHGWIRFSERAEKHSHIYFKSLYFHSWKVTSILCSFQNRDIAATVNAVWLNRQAIVALWENYKRVNERISRMKNPDSCCLNTYQEEGFFSTEMSWMLLTHEFKEGWVMFASQTEKYMLEDRYYRFCDKQRLITMPYAQEVYGKVWGKIWKNFAEGHKWAGRYSWEELFTCTQDPTDISFSVERDWGDMKERKE